MIAVTGSCKSAPAASGGKVETGAMQHLINKYKGEEGFEVMSFGGLALGLVKMAANASSDAEERDLYLEKIYDVDDANVWNEIPRGKGMYISKDEIETIEFFQKEDIENGK